ncbi:RNA polymerase subunit sigma [Alicyclobacillus hesperidum]|uniref:RNA polymerase sigma factor n=1 Tax=Alicyclobacillus hesperidum TaxID=89784 RepID=A0AA37X427_9BACL|nr:sigma-70 family RNA polymerase sigma factor [Alicyclobacillus hesperidum]GLV13522.1 RNA polymerase subunit sigma [Alicyclobacillus hesperidum]
MRKMRQQSSAELPAAALLEQWMDAYGQDVVRLAYSYVHNYHKAEDIAQDVFLRAWQNYASFQGQSSIKTWLLAITANRAKDVLRSWSVRHELIDDGELLTSLPVTHDTARIVEQRLERDEVWRAVRSLPEMYREVVELYYGNDLSSAEIASVLGVNDQTVRTRLHRGRLLLQKALIGEGEGR